MFDDDGDETDEEEDFLEESDNELSDEGMSRRISISSILFIKNSRTNKIALYVALNVQDENIAVGCSSLQHMDFKSCLSIHKNYGSNHSFLL